MAEGTVRELLDDVADEVAVARNFPTAVSAYFGAYDDGDTTPRRLVRALTKTCDFLAKQLDFEVLKEEATFITSEGEEQLNWRPERFRRFVPDTVWNRDGNLPLYALDSRGWQQYRAGYLVPVYPAYYLRGRRFFIASPPGPDQTVAFEYITTTIGHDADGGEVSRFTSDDDVPLFDDEVLRLGTVYFYRWMRREDFAADQQAFEYAFQAEYKNDGDLNRFDMSRVKTNNSDFLVESLKNRVIAVGTQRRG